MRRRRSPIARRALAIGVGVTFVCLASAGVYATTLTVTANQDYATTTGLSPCQSSSIEVKSDKATTIEPSDLLAIAGFTVSGLPAGCAGTLYVTAVSTTGTQIEDFTAQLDGTGAPVHLDFAVPQLQDEIHYAAAVHA